MSDSSTLTEYRFDVTALFGIESYRKFRRGSGRWRLPAWLNPRRLRAHDRAYRKATGATRSEKWQTWMKQATEHGRLAIAPRGKVVIDVADTAREDALSERTDGGFAYGQAFAVQVFADTRPAAHACVESIFRARAVAASEGEETSDEGTDVVHNGTPGKPNDVAKGNGGKRGRAAVNPDANSPPLFVEWTIDPFDPTKGQGRAIAAEFDQLRGAYATRRERVLSTRDFVTASVSAKGGEKARADGGGFIEPTGSSPTAATVGRVTILSDYGAGHPGGVIWADLTAGPPASERPKPAPVTVEPENEFRFDVGASMGTESYRCHPIVPDRYAWSRWEARERALEAADVRAHGERWPAWQKRVATHGQIAFAARGPVLTNPSEVQLQPQGRQDNAKKVELVERTTLTGEIAYGQAFAVQVFAEDYNQARACVELAFEEGIYSDLFTGYRIEPFYAARGGSHTIAAQFDRLRDAQRSANEGSSVSTANSNPNSSPDSEITYVLADFGSGYPAGVMWANLAPSAIP